MQEKIRRFHFLTEIFPENAKYQGRPPGFLWENASRFFISCVLAGNNPLPRFAVRLL